MNVRKNRRFWVAVEYLSESGDGGIIQTNDSVFVTNGVPIAFTVGDALGKTSTVMIPQSFWDGIGS